MGLAGIADKHHTHLVFRAVENRLTMIKADRAFDSAIIDPYGRLVTHGVSSKGVRRVLVAQGHLGLGKQSLEAARHVDVTEEEAGND